MTREKENKIKITPATGRPMLQWVGKKPLDYVKGFPAQLIETFLLNTINLQTMIATKASRVVYATKSRPVVEFGLRRTQGTDAGMKAARCSYIAGCNGTSNVLAVMKYGIPIFGTMAHSYVMFFDKEIEDRHRYANYWSTVFVRRMNTHLRLFFLF